MPTKYPEDVIASLLQRRHLRPKADCQGERQPFLSVRTKAADVRPSIRQAADEMRLVLRKRILADVKADGKLSSLAQTIYWLRGALNEIELNGSDGA